MKKIEKVTLIGLGAMGVFFAPRIAEKLGANFRILASGARKERLEQKGVTVPSNAPITAFSLAPESLQLCRPVFVQLY